MRNFFMFFMLVGSLSSLAQSSKPGDTLRPGIYDTMRIEISSTTSFPFCSNLYKLPRDCNDNMPPNCCSYSTSLEKNEKISRYGSVSCGNGSSLFWYYYGSLGSAKQDTDGVLPQWKGQQKELNIQNIKCMVMGKEMEAYMVEMVSFQDHKSYILLTYGTYNGYIFTLQYHSMKKISSNEDIQPFLREIIRFQ
jgi:hypothetical protein